MRPPDRAARRGAGGGSVAAIRGMAFAGPAPASGRIPAHARGPCSASSSAPRFARGSTRMIASVGRGRRSTLRLTLNVQGGRSARRATPRVRRGRGAMGRASSPTLFAACKEGRRTEVRPARTTTLRWVGFRQSTPFASPQPRRPAARPANFRVEEGAPPAPTPHFPGMRESLSRAAFASRRRFAAFAFCGSSLTAFSSAATDPSRSVRMSLTPSL